MLEEGLGKGKRKEEAVSEGGMFGLLVWDERESFTLRVLSKPQHRDTW